jgi:hypothetical protein
MTSPSFYRFGLFSPVIVPLPIEKGNDTGTMDGDHQGDPEDPAPNALDQLVARIDALEGRTREDLVGNLWGYSDIEVEAALSWLDDETADMLVLHLIYHKGQHDLAEIFGLTQAAISYRLLRARASLRLLLERPKYRHPDDLYQRLLRRFDEVHATTLTKYYYCGCQKAVADELGVSQGRVRNHLMWSVRKLVEEAVEDPSFEPTSRFFYRMIKGSKKGGGEAGYLMYHLASSNTHRGKRNDKNAHPRTSAISIIRTLPRSMSPEEVIEACAKQGLRCSKGTVAQVQRRMDREARRPSQPPPGVTVTRCE